MQTGMTNPRSPESKHTDAKSTLTVGRIVPLDRAPCLRSMTIVGLMARTIAVPTLSRCMAAIGKVVAAEKVTAPMPSVMRQRSRSTELNMVTSQHHATVSVLVEEI